MIWILTAVLFSLIVWAGIGELRDFSRGRWLFLLCLRLAVFLILLAWLGGFRWSLPGHGQRGGEIVLLVDGSRSMMLPQGSRAGSRWDRARDLGRVLEKRFPDFRTSWLALAGDSLLPYKNKLEKPSDHTALGRGVILAQKLRPSAIVLMSDGNNNAGDHPVTAAAGGVPVYTIGLGPSTPDGRPLIAEALLGSEAEAGQPVEVRLWIKGDPAGCRALVLENGKVLARRRLAETSDSVATVSFIPQGLGLHKYELVLDGPGGRQDSRSLSLAVVKRDFRLACLAPLPDWDLRFLSQLVDARPGYALDQFLLKNKRWEGLEKDNRLVLDSLGRYDLFILFGGSGYEPGLQQRIYQLVQGEGKSVLFFGRSPDDGPLAALRPLKAQAPLAGLLGTASAAPGLSGSGLLTGKQSLQLERLPPLSLESNHIAAHSDVAVLSSIVLPGGKTVPWWARRYCGEGRAAQFAVTDLWKLQLTAAGAGRDTALYSSIMLGTLDWLLGTAADGIVLETEKKLYPQGDEISFKGHWENYRDKEGEQSRWSVTIEDAKAARKTIRLDDWGRGDYRGSAGSQAPGEYRYQASLVNRGTVIKRNTGKFWVIPDRSEENDHLQNVKLLKEVAKAGGGQYWDSNQESMPLNWNIKAEGAAALDNPDFQVFVIIASLLLGAEWFLRRKWGRN